MKKKRYSRDIIVSALEPFLVKCSKCGETVITTSEPIMNFLAEILAERDRLREALGIPVKKGEI